MRPYNAYASVCYCASQAPVLTLRFRGHVVRETVRSESAAESLRRLIKEINNRQKQEGHKELRGIVNDGSSLFQKGDNLKAVPQQDNGSRVPFTVTTMPKHTSSMWNCVGH